MTGNKHQDIKQGHGISAGFFFPWIRQDFSLYFAYQLKEKGLLGLLSLY